MSDTTAGGPGTGPRLRIAVVGPTHPLKGGVAAHTTTLAHQLAEVGHEVTLVSWTHLYPRLLYPGQQAVPDGTPDVQPFPRTVRVLSWANPGSWLDTGRRLRGHDLVVIVHVVPHVVPAHLAIIKVACASGGPRVVVLAHNVLPHEPRPGDRQLVSLLLRRADGVLVHSGQQAGLAADLGARAVSTLDLPPHLPGGAPVPHVPGTGRTRLLSLGLVREYKGIHLLLEAVADVPGVEVTVAGEMWGQAGQRVRQLGADPRLTGRVALVEGYVPADDLAGLLARHDVLALTYRSATASQNVLLAQLHGLPVLATAVGTFAQQVQDGTDGLVVPPDDRAALTAALRTLADPGEVARLRAGVQPPDLSGPWRRYVSGLLDLVSERDR